MFIKSAFTALLALAAQQVSAQNATSQEVAVVVANFEQAGLVPQFLATFNPEGVLNASYGGSVFSIGQALDQTAVSSAPTAIVAVEDGATDLSAGSDYTYTTLLADADIVGTDETTTNQTFHWLVNGATVGSDSSLDFTSATTVISYVGPGPSSGSGAHRYVLLLVRQYSNFTAPTDVTTFAAYSTADYLETTGLGSVVAATYFTVEVGTATAAVSTTSAVNTATVAGSSSSAAASSSAASASSAASSASKSATKSASTSTAAATSTASTGAAMKLNQNLIVPAVTILGVAVGALMI